MSMRKRALSVLLAITVMITFMPFIAVEANAASKTSNKVMTVSSEKNTIGDNTKYTYNKKGFVTKMVSKYTKKDYDSDSVETVTTTFKYNKKNRITTKTTKDVEKVTTYKTSPTTGKSTGQSLGTVTTTTTDVTKYTYKNGRATKAVTTTTVVKSGSITENDVELALDEVTELNNGSFIAGYNYRNADGTYIDEYWDKAANAYYYTGDVNAAAYTGTTTTTYTNNGNGTYTETVSKVTNYANFKETPVKTYYKRDGNGSYVPCAENDNWNFYRTESVNIEADSSKTPSSDTRTTSTVITDKDVTTTTFKYDTKKRVKQANVSTVATLNEAVSESRNNTYSESGTDEIYDEATDSDKDVKYTTNGVKTSTSSHSTSYTEKSSSVEKYTYNKKNRKTKTVVTDKGVENSTSVTVEGRTNTTDEYTTTYEDGKTASGKSSETYSGEGDTTTIVCANGNQTTTTTNNPYTRTSSESRTRRDGGSSTTNSTTAYTFYQNGGSMTVTASNEDYRYADGSSDIEDRTTTTYWYDDKGEKSSTTVDYKDVYTPASGTASTYVRKYSDYNDGKESKRYYDSSKYDNEPEEVYTDDAAVKAVVEKANADLIATGTPFTETKVKAVKARPSKTTTKYTYDKQGNLKTAKTTQNWTAIETLRNETYGHPIYQFDAEGKTEAVETTVNHTYKNNRTMENTVKTGSNRVKTATTIGTSASDRSTLSYTVGGRVTYTLKSKTIAKKAIRTDVELQQWMIQNPGCGSVAGLF